MPALLLESSTPPPKHDLFDNPLMYIPVLPPGEPAALAVLVQGTASEM